MGCNCNCGARNPVWIVTASSESGDDYGPVRFDHQPTTTDLRNFISDTGEELDVDGPGDFGSYVRVKVDKL